MKKLTNQEKEKLLSRLYWDMDIMPEDIIRLLDEDFGGKQRVEKVNLYCRLLRSYDWYTLLKLVPPEFYKEMLSEPVLKCIYPKELRDKYIYAGEILSQ